MTVYCTYMNMNMNMYMNMQMYLSVFMDMDRMYMDMENGCLDVRHPQTQSLFLSLRVIIDLQRALCVRSAVNGPDPPPATTNCLLAGPGGGPRVNCAWVEVSRGHFVVRRIIKAPGNGHINGHRHGLGPGGHCLTLVGQESGQLWLLREGVRERVVFYSIADFMGGPNWAGGGGGG